MKKLLFLFITLFFISCDSPNMIDYYATLHKYKGSIILNKEKLTYCQSCDCYKGWVEINKNDTIHQILLYEIEYDKINVKDTIK